MFQQMPKLLDLTGQRFSRWKILSKSPRKERCAYWLCVCDCGNQKEVSSQSLKLGDSTSCGCRQKEVAKENGKKVGNLPKPWAIKHGMTNTKEFQAWMNMKARCNNPKFKLYPRYGGRGIQVCVEWQSNFESFYRDMGKRPSPKHSLDRIDNNKGYSKDNCRWATIGEQALNTSRNVYIEKDGIKLSITQWSLKLGGTSNLIANRLLRGWSIERAISTQVKVSKV